jgi:parvulin-like peptidyl-prolyl isomerase
VIKAVSDPGTALFCLKGHTMSVILRRTIPLCAILLLVPVLSVRAQGGGDPVVARAGNAFISEREFQERFELTPGLYRQRKAQLEQEKLTFLYSMIAEKLLAQEACERGLDTLATYRTAIADLTKLLARDALYRTEVRQKVLVAPAEISAGLRRAVQQRLVSFLYFPDEASAQFVRSQLRTAKDFDRHRVDASMQALRDTATVIWGDADTTIEAAAYRLGPDDLSPVVRAGEGWYILRLLRAERNPVLADMPPQTLRERVLTRIRMRKERAREEAFAQALLRERPSSSPPALFRAVAEAVSAVFTRHYAPPSMSLTVDMSQEVLDRLAGKEGDTLIIAGNTAWNVSEAVSRLVTRGFSVSGDSVRGVASRLYTVFREWAEQELLAQEAISRGLDQSPEVQARLMPWRDHYLSGMTERRIHEQTRISDAEVFAYMHASDSSFPLPQVQLRVLHTTTAREMQDAFQFMEQGGAFEDAVRKFSVDPEAQRGGMTPFFAVNERPPLGIIAARLDTGQCYGPLRDSTGYFYFQVLHKRNAPEAGDTSFAGRFTRASRELLQMKQRRAVTLFTAQSAANRGVDVYSERLKLLTVTPLPMLSYRLLGFGGRMFEVPFVSPKVEWLDVEPPKEKILP